MTSLRLITTGLLFLAGLGIFSACSSDDDAGGTAQPQTGSPEQTGSASAVATDCYPDVDHATLQGDVQCLDRVRGGYCTHLCQTDADCCAVPGECDTTLRQVCAPFESTGQMMCFLSCEREDLTANPNDPNGELDESEFCQREASADFICRSSGGGSQNRKICVPGDCGVGASCVADADCSGGLECSLDYRGGYCGAVGCTSDAECANGARCVADAAGGGFCARECQADTDCSFCRWSNPMACDPDVTLIDGATASICQPVPN